MKKEILILIFLTHDFSKFYHYLKKFEGTLRKMRENNTLCMYNTISNAQEFRMIKISMTYACKYVSSIRVDAKTAIIETRNHNL